ncbi:4-(gamma-L-glutamylamino)butanoyl-[BtrI acyl-carrier protein] monooxygenase BtrO [Actinosynnema sp. ALI-1.44]
MYSDNDNVDPWLVTQMAMQSTESAVPLVAVQPIAMHPHSVAKMICSLAYLHGRQVHINLVSGGFAKHLAALGDHISHDERYDRLVEYAAVIDGLLTKAPHSHSGQYFSVRDAYFERPLPVELRPHWFVSGSSPAAARAAAALDVPRLAYPRPVHDYEKGGAETSCAPGIRVGVLARENGDDAWREARKRFPDSEVGQLMHEMAVAVSDSHWHSHLAEREGDHLSERRSPYWLHPFRNYKTFCPYLVGSYREVGGYLARYFAAGVRTLVLDVPSEEDDLHHAHLAVAEARRVASNSVPAN